MIRTFALMILIALTLAGAAHGADQPANPSAQPAVTTTSEPGPPAEPAPTPIQVTETPEKPRNAVNVLVGLYKPINSQTADLYGDNWIRFGLKTLPVNYLPKWRPTFDINYYAMSKKFVGPPDLTNRATLIPATLGLTRGFGSEERKWFYLSFGAGPYYANISTPTIGVSKAGFGLNANAILGIRLHQRWTLEARYELFTEFAGQKFDAFVISLAYKLKELKQK